MNANRIKKARAAAVLDESGHLAVPLSVVRGIAAAENLSVREFEAELLEENIIPRRYLRSIGTFGADGQAKLLRASAAVVGCGGLGGWIAELLARAGVGRLTLIDGDVFSESNLNRQLLCTESNLGRGKAETAAARVREINGAVEAVPRSVMLTGDNAENLMRGNDIAFDALDNLPSRLLLMKTAQALKIPMIHGAVAGWWGQACAVHGGSAQDGCAQNSCAQNSHAECGNAALASMWEGGGEQGMETVTGTPGFTPAAVASMQVALGIRALLGLDKTIPSELLWLDLETPGLEKLPLK